MNKEERLQKMKELSDEIFGLMKEGVKDLWKKEDEDFLRKLSNDVAQQKILADISDKTDIHIQNIQHLAVTLQGEMVRKSLKIRVFKKEMFIKILVTIIKTVAVPLLKAAIKKN